MTVLKVYDDNAEQWEPIVVGRQGPTGPTGPQGPTGPAGPVPASIDDFGDVTITTPVDGQVLIYEAGGWKNGAPLFVTVNHGTNAETPRPLASIVYWIGAVMPDNGAIGDVWWMDRPHLPALDPWDYDGNVWVRRSDGELGFPGPDMLFTLTTPSDNFTVLVPVRATVNVDIDWGDGTVDTGVTSANPTHEYATAGSYDVTVSGSATGFGSSNASQWGNRVTGFRAIGRLGITDMFQAFSAANALDSGFHGDAWDVSSVTNMSRAFQGCAVNRPIGSWDVSNVTNMSVMFGDEFTNNSLFNQDISRWDTSSVASMLGMFRRNLVFNRPIGSWDVSNVTNMSVMFRDARAFNQNIGAWDVSNVTSFDAMFSAVFTGPGISFNNGGSPDINNWDVSSAATVRSMFRHAYSFQQPLDKWLFTGSVNIAEFMGARTGGNSYNTPDYNDLLVRWDALVAAGTLDDSRTVDMGGAQHSGAGTTARNNLTAAGWTIVDGGAA